MVRGGELEVEVEHEYEHDGREPLVLGQWAEVPFEGLAHLHAVIEVVGLAEAVHLAQQPHGASQPLGAASELLPEPLQARRGEPGYLLGAPPQLGRRHVELEAEVYERAVIRGLHSLRLVEVYLQQQGPIVVLPF